MIHQCYLCSPDNPDRVFEGSTATFGDRFDAGDGRVHGGMAAAALTCPALERAAQSGIENPVVDYVSGRLNLAVPLKTPLEAKARSGNDFSVELFAGDTPMVSGTASVIDSPSSPGSIIKEIPAELAEDVAGMSLLVNANLEGPTLVEQTVDLYAAEGSAYDVYCYGCSEKPPALKIYMRSSENGDLWSCWEPDPECIDEPDRLATATVVAALDCSNLWAVNAQERDLGVPMRLHDKKSWITGTHAVHFLRVPNVSRDYRIVTRYLRQEGRKAFTMAALFDLEGEIYAVAEAISIFIDLPPETT